MTRLVMWLVLLSSSAFAQISFIGSTTANATTVNVPVGVQSGDLFVLAYTNDNGQLGAIGWPAGFRAVHAAAVDNPDGQGWGVAIGFATGTEVSLSVRATALPVMLTLAVYRGVDPMMPLDDEGEAHSSVNFGTGSPWSLNSPQVESSSAANWAVFIGGADRRLGLNVPGFDGGSSLVSYSAPIGFTMHEANTLIYNTLMLADTVLSTPGTHGPFTASASVNYLDVANTVVFLLSLRPQSTVVSFPNDDVAFVGAATSAHASGAMVPVEFPPGLQSGDVVLGLLLVDDNVAPAWPAGFTAFASRTELTPHAQVLSAAWKVITGAEPMTTLTVGTQGTVELTLLAYRNVDLIDPVSPPTCRTSAQMVGPWALPNVDVTAGGAGSRFVTAVTYNVPTRDLGSASPPVTSRERHDQSIERLLLAVSDELSLGGTQNISGATVTDALGLSGTAGMCVYRVNKLGTGVRPDAGVDAGMMLVDAGAAADAGVSDAGAAADAGASDAGAPAVDAGVSDGGVSDAGVSDAGMSDAGVSDADAGRDGSHLIVGCGCGSLDDVFLLAALALVSRRRTRSWRDEWTMDP